MMMKGTGVMAKLGVARRRSARGRRAPGFTLLEMLVAITIVASVSALLGALWAQTHRWASENGSSLRAMRLPRAQEFLRAQWADRRGSFKLTDSGESVVAEPGRVSFVAASPMLFPDWPVVRATLIVERDDETAAGSAPAWRLVYEETKLGNLTAPPQEAEKLIAQGKGELVRRHVVLDGLARLELERFGVGNRSRQKQGSLTLETPEAGGEEGEKKAPVEVTSIAPLGEAERRLEDEKRWRLFDEPFRGEVPAVRIVGEYEGEEFSCVFVIAGLR